MLIENEFDVAATPAEVYALMLDPERVATCIQGAEVTGKNDDGSYDAQVTVKLGPVKMTYKGTIAIIESDPEARTASMLAKGSRGARPGHGAGHAEHGRDGARGRLARERRRRHARSPAAWRRWAAA